METLTIVPGAGGVFDVKVDDRLVYSKHKTGSFPEYAQIEPALTGR